MGVIRMDIWELLGQIVGKFDPAWSERPHLRKDSYRRWEYGKNLIAIRLY